MQTCIFYIYRQSHLFVDLAYLAHMGDPGYSKFRTRPMKRANTMLLVLRSQSELRGSEFELQCDGKENSDVYVDSMTYKSTPRHYL